MRLTLERCRKATQDSEKALELNPQYIKAITRAAQAQLKLGKKIKP